MEKGLCIREDGVEMGPRGVIVPYSGAAYRAMRMASTEDSSIKERCEFYLLRAQEELYDWSTDPGSWNNLAEDPEYSDVLKAARSGLLQWMKSSDDPLAGDYLNFVNSME